MAQLFSNNFKTTLKSAITSVQTTLELNSTSGLPTLTNAQDFFLLTLYTPLNVEETNHEVVKVTAVNGSVLTVERAYEGTARAFTAGTPIELRGTAKTFSLLHGFIDALNTFKNTISATLSDFTRQSNNSYLLNKSVCATCVDLGAGTNLDLSLGNYFKKTITGATTLTLSNIPTSGTQITFSLELTNGGSATVTLWSGVLKPGGKAITLTVSGKDRLTFTSGNGGTTWDLALLQDLK